MAHSIELLFDDHTEAALRAVWEALDTAGVPSQNRVQSTTNRPHVTVVVAGRINPAVDSELAELRDHLPLPCTVGAPLIFGRGRFVLAQLIVPSAPLLELQHAVHRICLPHMPAGVSHTEPEHWTPHVTLGRRLSAEQVGLALAHVPGDLPATFTGLRRWDGDARVDHSLVS